MIPMIGWMISAYIIARMVDTIAERTESGWLRGLAMVLCVAAIAVAVIGGLALLLIDASTAAALP